MKKSTLITHLPTLGRVLTPVAMLVTLTREIVESQAAGAGPGWLIAIHIGALATVIGIESVGILAGHTFEGYWRLGDKPRAAIAFTLLGIYTAVGIAILWHNPAMLPIPIIASVVYLVSGLAESLDATQTQRARASASQSAFELDEEKKDRELARQLQIKKADAAAAAKLARIRVKAAAQNSQPAPQTFAAPPQTPQSAKFYECSCGEVFAKPQSYSAHRRHCNAGESSTAEIVKQNGHLNGATS
jgi:hypothetical protein